MTFCTVSISNSDCNVCAGWMKVSDFDESPITRSIESYLIIWLEISSSLLKLASHLMLPI